MVEQIAPSSNLPDYGGTNLDLRRVLQPP